MSVRDTLMRWLLGVEKKQLTYWRTTGVQGMYSTVDDDITALITAYRRNPIVYACVRAKADAITDPTVLVERRNDKGEYETEHDHPLTNLLMEPNPNLSAEQFARAWMVSREVTGTFFCEIVRSKAGLPAELYPLDPETVFPVYDQTADGRVVLLSYEFADGSYRKPIPLKNMLAMSDWNLGGTLSPLAVTMAHVSNDDSHTGFIRSYWANAGIPAGLLSVKRDALAPRMTDDEIEEKREQWAASYGVSSGRAGRIAILEDDVTYQRTGMNLSELTSKDLREVDEARICMTLGVPPLIVYAYTGLQSATYSNLDEAWTQFWQTTMSIQAKDLRTFLSRTLLREYETDTAVRSRSVRVGWDLSEVGSLQEDVTQIEDRAIKKWEKGIATLDETRAAVDMPPHPDPAYGALNAFELQALAKALGGGAAAAALEAGYNAEESRGLDGRLYDIEYMLASVSNRVAELATLPPPNGNGHDALLTEENGRV